MLVIANWKLHGSKAENINYIQALEKKLQGLKGEFVICPPVVYLDQICQLGKACPSLKVGAQNISDQQQGAFTGEVSAQMICDVGCRYVLIGHMERRILYGESDHMIAQKYRIACEHGLQAVLCVGETAEQHDRGIAQEVIMNQLCLSMEKIQDSTLLATPIIAYEPGWAIGTDRHATEEEIFEIHQFIYNFLLDSVQGCMPRVLYGGSVKPDNAQMLFNIKYVGGVLVGGASLNVDAFATICREACKQQN